MSDHERHFERAIAMEETHSSNAWMLTLADLLSLLLTFFILMYSMSSLRTEQWDGVSKAFSKAFKVEKSFSALEFSGGFSIDKLQTQQGMNLDYLYGILADRVQTDPAALSGVHITRLDDRLVISLAGDSLFNPGSAELTPKAASIMYALGGSLYQLRNRIDIVGNTDPTVVQNPDYPSNWELSLARSMQIAEELHKAGYTYNINAYGLGSSHFDELVNGSENTRSASARRADIIIRNEAAKMGD